MAAGAMERLLREQNRRLTKLERRSRRGGLSAQVPVVRAWTAESGWPDRIPGRLNIWIGPLGVPFPWDKMTAEDRWLNADGTTNDEVTSQALDVSKPLNQAIRTVANKDRIDLKMQPRPGVNVPVLTDIDGSGTQELWGWAMPQSVGSAMIGGAPTPFGWTFCQVQVVVYVPSSSGNVRLGYAVTGFREGGATPTDTASLNNTLVGPFAGRVYSITLTGEIDLTLQEYVQVIVKRIGDSGLDTVAAPVYLLWAGIVRAG